MLWQLGTLVLLGYGIDPLGLLVPFLIFAIGVSPRRAEDQRGEEAAVAGVGSMEAARRTFRQLLVPAIIALLADLVGFITILLIPVQVIREMAVTASIGVAIVILTDLVLLPVLVSCVELRRALPARVEHAAGDSSPKLLEEPRRASPSAGRALDHHRVSRRCSASSACGKAAKRRSAIRRPACRSCAPDSRYNLDSNIITQKFSIGVDILTVIVETKEPACINHELMTAIDRFALAHAERRGRAGRDHAAVSSPRSPSPAGTRAA